MTARQKFTENENNDMALHTIEICAGVGMLGEGLRAGLAHLGHAVRPVCFMEREAYPAGGLAARIEEGSLDAAPIWSDLLTFDAGRWAGAVDGIVAGFPCQDLSLAGKRAGLDGKRSGLFFDILDIADASGAWFLFLENVAGIASATSTVMDEAAAAEITGERYRPAGEAMGEPDGLVLERAAARVVGELAERGWHTEWLTLSASEVGASHGRERWFCFAWRELDDSDSNGAQWAGGEKPGPCAGCETVGNPQGQRRGETRPSDPQAQHARSGGAEPSLANAQEHRRHQGRSKSSREQGRSDAAECGGAMANAECKDQQRPGIARELACTRSANESCDRSEQRPAADGGSNPMAHPSSPRQQGRELGTALHGNRGGGGNTWTS